MCLFSFLQFKFSLSLIRYFSTTFSLSFIVFDQFWWPPKQQHSLLLDWAGPAFLTVSQCIFALYFSISQSSIDVKLLHHLNNANRTAASSGLIVLQFVFLQNVRTAVQIKAPFVPVPNRNKGCAKKSLLTKIPAR